MSRFSRSLTRKEKRARDAEIAMAGLAVLEYLTPERAYEFVHARGGATSGTKEEWIQENEKLYSRLLQAARKRVADTVAK